MDSKEQSDALWIVIRDAVQLLNVAYLWKVPVDEQWRMSYQELTERINKLSGRPETPEGRPAPAASTGGLGDLLETWLSAWDSDIGSDPDRQPELYIMLNRAAMVTTKFLHPERIQQADKAISDEIARRSALRGETP